MYCNNASVGGLHAQIGIDEAVDVTVHNVLDVAVFKIGAVILCQLVGHENVGTDLAAPFDFHLYALDVGDFIQVLALLDFSKPRSEHASAVFQILEVTALYLRGNNNTGGDVDYSSP